jgi:hypothetical protein
MAERARNISLDRLALSNRVAEIGRISSDRAAGEAS